MLAAYDVIKLQRSRQLLHQVRKSDIWYVRGEWGPSDEVIFEPSDLLVVGRCLPARVNRAKTRCEITPAHAQSPSSSSSTEWSASDRKEPSDEASERTRNSSISADDRSLEGTDRAGSANRRTVTSRTPHRLVLLLMLLLWQLLDDRQSQAPIRPNIQYRLFFSDDKQLINFSASVLHDAIYHSTAR